jgi:DNA-binding CsgD family transcriptional regulator
MQTLSLKKIRALMRALEEIHGAEDPNQIPGRVFETLVQVVPATLLCKTTFNLRTGPVLSASRDVGSAPNDGDRIRELTAAKSGDENERVNSEDIVIFDLLAPHLAIAHRNLERVEKLRRMARQVIPKPTDLERVGLTAREAEVLHWVMQGKSDDLIASILEISVRTVNQHIAAILKKLQSETRGSAGYEAMVKLRKLETLPQTAGIAVAG